MTRRQCLAHLAAAACAAPLLRRLPGAVAQSPRPGFFRLTRRRSRWMLLDPAGRPFFMRAVYGVDWSDGGVAAELAFRQDFNQQPLLFAKHAVNELRSWGFNTLGCYATDYALPVGTYSREQGNPEEMPFIRGLNVSWYGALNTGNFAPAPFKTLLAGAVDRRVYRDWPGHVPDVFDPNFAVYARAVADDRANPGHQAEFTHPLAASPWLLATIADDSDDLFGFGPGPEIPGVGGVVHPHLGWVVAITAPYQNVNTEVGAALGSRHRITYTDSTVYAKAAWSAYLQTKYHSIANLNLAWGAQYTTFGSDGGWPSGSGVLDESGRHAWLGSARGDDAPPAVRADLDAFLSLYAERYYQTTSAAIRAADPNHLVFSDVLDGFGGLTRAPILRAAGRYCDALQLALNRERPEVLDRSYSIAPKPVFAWLGFRADADSALHGRDAVDGVYNFASQADRAQAYTTEIDWMFHHRVHDRDYPIFGFAWWEYMDKLGERANWGLVNPSGAAYTGFVNAVTAANRQVDRELQRLTN
ncbi:MAG TPA: hypothetical protein VN709_02835 [Terriglobales bacterium]|nr:hypothetical protein [Terriglobales bacterium]